MVPNKINKGDIMKYFLKFAFIFFIGCIIGWIIELLFRRITAKKWVNPGLLVGPYLPIYGFGLCTLTDLYLLFSDYCIHPLFVILFIGICLTLIEFIGGLVFIKGCGIKIWDYSDRWGNFKGLICPLFSLIWTFVGAIYYYFVVEHLLDALVWFDSNSYFSYFLGIFSGILIIDVFYSTNLLSKIKDFAFDNNIVIKLVELKKSLVKGGKNFLFPFKFTSLKETLNNYIDRINKK